MNQDERIRIEFHECLYETLEAMYRDPRVRAYKPGWIRAQQLSDQIDSGTGPIEARYKSLPDIDILLLMTLLIIRRERGPEELTILLQEIARRLTYSGA
jgi:hypothetical protein